MGNPAAHNIISPSGAHRWIRCTPSARLAEKFPHQESAYAVEGTVAHELAEYYLSTGKRNKGVKDKPEYSPEMEVYVSNYVDYARALNMPGDLHFTELSVPAYYSPDPTACTIDRCYFRPDTGEIHVLDLKYGKGVRVNAYENEQARTYGACFAQWLAECNTKEYKRMVKAVGGFQKVVYHIMQPRLDHISVWDEPFGNLMIWVENTLKPAAKKAYKGEGELNPGDKQCKFCPAKTKCKGIASAVLKGPQDMQFKEPKLFTEDEFAKMLAVADMAKSWYSAIETEAKKVLSKGGKIEGYKLVEGISRRAYINPEGLKSFLTLWGYDRSKFIKETLIGVPELEKLVGKDFVKESLTDYITKPPGAPTLAREDDKRVSFRDAKSDFKEFIVEQKDK